MTASNELLDKLHAAVGEQLLARIESGEANASDFAQAIKFLKDNGIEAIPTADNPLGILTNTLSQTLPFSSDSQH